MQSQSYIDIVKAIPLVRSSLGSWSYEESITVFFKEPDSSEESALSFHLSRRLTDTNATLTITNGLTTAFVGDIDAGIRSLRKRVTSQTVSSQTSSVDSQTHPSRFANVNALFGVHEKANRV